MKNKKGISPLIATVLLVGLVVVMALIIWFWYGQVIKSNTDKSSISSLQACAQDVDYELKSICKESSTLRFKVENKGIAIPRFKVTFTGSSGSKVSDTSIGASTGTSQDITITIPSDIGNLDGLRITPLISSGGQTRYCEDQSKELTQTIQPC